MKNQKCVVLARPDSSGVLRRPDGKIFGAIGARQLSKHRKLSDTQALEAARDLATKFGR